MKILNYYLFLVAFLFTNLSHSKTLLEISCEENKGQIVQKITCPQSKVERNEPFCVLKKNMFYNGCSSSDKEFGDFFFESCVLHDFCYHHEPSYSGKSKDQCDQKFLSNMRATCKSHSSSFKCNMAARSYYLAVKKFGEDSWNCSDEPMAYPQ